MNIYNKEISLTDIEIIKEDCLKYLTDNNGLDPDEDDGQNWVESIIGGGSWVVDCHIWDPSTYDDEYDDEMCSVGIAVYDTYVDDDSDHRLTDTSDKICDFELEYVND